MIVDVSEHGTPEGYRQGCRGRGACDPAQPWTCMDAWTRYRGDLTYRRRVDAGLSPAEIAAADAEDRKADLRRQREAKLVSAAAPVKVARAPREPRVPRERKAATPKLRMAPKAKAAPKRERYEQRPATKRRHREVESRPVDPVERARATAGLARRAGLHRPSYGEDAHGLPAGYARGCRAADEATCPSALRGGKSCMQAQREYQQAWREARRQRPIPRQHHGSPYGYMLGCKAGADCPADPSCSDARAAAERDRRRSKGVKPRKKPEHGTRGGYRAGCHRDEGCPSVPTCRQANNEQQRAARGTAA